MNGINKHVVPSLKYGVGALMVFLYINLLSVLAAMIWPDLTFDFSLSFLDHSLYYFSVKDTGFQWSGSFIVFVLIFGIGLLVYLIKEKVTKQRR
ncbi:hypothetical protein GLW00_12345 [Halobacillus litoralis]|uniref:Uncharacterized protein n=1 Tax=Halobacillus litoralis TaxID=45668 RepID=A0A845FCQ8_9BACI|nr:hypothetical protein [Halobacillus litoralis]MYL71649.1 hypothetical protein [Halobacillus litoralis]